MTGTDGVVVDWARHGENVANLSRTLSHRVFDGDLTELGRAQAHELGARLAASERTYAVIAASPLRRAVQTAEIAAQHLGKRRVDLVVEEFREIDPGEYDGRSDDQAWNAHRDVLLAWADGDLTARCPGGEDGRELADRMSRGLLTVASRADGDAALVVAHGGNIRFALPSLTGDPVPEHNLGNGEMVRLRVGLDRMQLVAWPFTD